MNIAEIRAKFPQYADIPDGELVRGLHRAHYSDMPYTDFLKSIDFREKVDPTGEMNAGEKFTAGFGKAMYDIGQGAAQMVGLGESGQETANRKEMDQPLVSGGAGLAGNVAGAITSLAPLAVVPGANTVGGATALGVLAGSLQPTQDVAERAVNMFTGGALGGGTQAVVGPGARAAGNWAAGREAEQAALKSQNAIRDATLRDAHAAGYVVPPSAVGGSTVGNILESISGKAAIGQESALRNQEVTNRLARKALGVADDTPISEGMLKALRKTAAQPYRDVAGLSKQAEMNLEALKNARFEANAYQKHYAVSADPKSLAESRRLAQQADMLEQSLEQQATQAGRPELVKALRDARKQIAKTYEVERALNVGTGDVSAKALGRALDKGKPLSDELAVAGRFAEAFPSYAREGAAIPTPNVSKSAAIVSLLLSGGGSAAAGPAGIAAGALPFVAPPLAQKALLSRPVQDAIANPSYGAGPVVKSAAALNDPETQKRLAALVRALALPAAPMAVNQ